MNVDDPKFTAHVLGESEDLTPAERAEIEVLLARDPAAATEAAETRALAVRLRAELLGEAAAPLEEHQRAAVFEAAKMSGPAEKVIRFPRRAPLFTAAAACAVVGVSIGLIFQALQTPSQGGVAPIETAASVPVSLPQDLSSMVVQESLPHAPLLAASTPAVPPVAPVPPIPAQYANGGILKTAAVPLNLPTGTAVPQMATFTTTNITASNGAAVISTGVVNLNGSVVKFSSSTVTTINMGSNLSVAPAPSALHPSATVVAANTASASLPPVVAYPQPVNPPVAQPEAPKPSGQGRETEFPTIARADMAWAWPRRAFNASSDLSEENDIASAASGFNSNAFDTVAENDFRAVHDNPLSTFSVDVDTASYAIVRRFLNSNRIPPKGAVRTEELLNYFTYDYPQPKGDLPFSATMEVAACPWAPGHRLVRVGLKGREVPRDQRPPSNIVFLIDVSGSMNMPNKLPLLQQAFRLLIEQLGPQDRVAIVTYAGSTGIILDSTQDKEAMQAAIDRLRADGSTNGASGVQLAYQVAERNFIRGGTNRVILATDGDWNVGVTNQSDLLEMIAQKAKSGVFLTVLGFGLDNLQDTMLVKLADRGNGHYAYIDTPLEAKKVFVEQLSGTLVTIARDVKLQVEFNPAKVGAYRLIGYEKRLLAKEDFNNDKKDAGEIGAGHTVTALYEVVPAGQEMPPIAAVDKLKYQPLPSTAGDGLQAVATPTSELPVVSEPTLAPAPRLQLQLPQATPAGRNSGKSLALDARTIPHAAPVESAPVDKLQLLPPHSLQPNPPRPVEQVPRGGKAELLPPHDLRPRPSSEMASPAPAKPYLVDGKSPKITRVISDGDSKTSHVTVVDAGNADAPPIASTAAAAPSLTTAMRNEMLTLKLRYKAPDGDKSSLLEFPLTDHGTEWDKSSSDFRFAAAVAGYGMLLRDSGYRGQTTWESVAAWAHEGLGTDKSGYRDEFLGLVKKAQALER